MQSNGGVISAERAAERPIRTLESGPAGGVIGCLALARELGYENVICADVGGTSYDVALIDGGRILETTETEVGGRLVAEIRLIFEGRPAPRGPGSWADSAPAPAAPVLPSAAASA